MWLILGGRFTAGGKDERKGKGEESEERGKGDPVPDWESEKLATLL